MLYFYGFWSKISWREHFSHHFLQPRVKCYHVSKSTPSYYFSDLYSTILSSKVSTISDVHVHPLDILLSYLSIFTFVFLLVSLPFLTLLFEVFISFGAFDDSLLVLTILSNSLILTLLFSSSK